MVRVKPFFYKAFGSNEKEFFKLLYMPETMIIYRLFFEKNGKVDEWWNEYNNLTIEEKNIINPIIENNDFSKIDDYHTFPRIYHVLQYYTISRDDAEQQIKNQ